MHKDTDTEILRYIAEHSSLLVRDQLQKRQEGVLELLNAEESGNVDINCPHCVKVCASRCLWKDAYRFVNNITDYTLLLHSVCTNISFAGILYKQISDYGDRVSLEYYRHSINVVFRMDVDEDNSFQECWDYTNEHIIWTTDPSIEWGRHWNA